MTQDKYISKTFQLFKMRCAASLVDLHSNILHHDFPQHLTNDTGQIYFKDFPTFEKLFLKSKMLEISVSTGDLKTGHKKSIQEIIGKTLRSKHYS